MVNKMSNFVYYQCGEHKSGYVTCTKSYTNIKELGLDYSNITNFVISRASMEKKYPANRSLQFVPVGFGNNFCKLIYLLSNGTETGEDRLMRAEFAGKHVEIIGKE